MKQVYIKFTIDLAPAFYIFLMMLLFPTVLKLAGVVAWSWLAVLAPFWCLGVMIVATMTYVALRW